MSELGSSLPKILAEVKKRIIPTPQERLFIARLGEQLTAEVQQILAKEGLRAEVSVQGSVARDTWVRGEHDLDIFARFPETVERREWTDRFLPAVHKSLRRYRRIERYAEHPYLELWTDSDVRVNIVPCYAVEKGRWKSATDRSPYHTEYMRNHLTPGLRDEARLLKQFAKGVRVYGAEIRVGGFSGMLVETLVLRFQSFSDTIEEASRWKEPIFIDLEKQSSSHKFDSSFIVVDPVDPGRNLAAAVRPDMLWNLVAASREFSTRPDVSFFFPSSHKARTRKQFAERLSRTHSNLVAVEFLHPPLVQDVLWGQLFSLERALVGVAARNDFRVLRSQAWSDEKHTAAIILEVESTSLSPVRLHVGPPVSRRKESDEFLTRHLGAKDTVRGPWVRENRWVVQKKRGATSLQTLLKSALRDPRHGLTIPKQLEESVRRSSRVLVNEEVLPLVKYEEFGQVLWEFLDGKPAWLKPRKP